MVENPYKKFRESLRPLSEVPEGTDLTKLIITFRFDDKDVRCGGEGTIYAWADMRTAPMMDDLVLRRAANIDEDGYAIVKARAWMAENWLMVLLERIEPTSEVSNGE